MVAAFDRVSSAPSCGVGAKAPLVEGTTGATLAEELVPVVASVLDQVPGIS